jgi:predicted ATPase/tRNA A-37 threonylcarbamoyl transferase component Bud32
MKNEIRERVKKIFAEARRISPELRDQYLAEICGSEADDEIRCEVQSLLASLDEAEGFMQTPAVAEVADVICGERRVEKGKSLGNYEIIEQIGKGGMGEIFLARDKKLDRQVAVKILNEKFARHESNLSRFVREAKTASALNHPNILVIHDVGQSDRIHYIVSEYIKGSTLRQLLNERILNLAEALEIAVQIAAALAAAHEANLIHRDIKPENIMIRPDGLLKVLDFGLAKLIAAEAPLFGTGDAPTDQTAQGIIMGTVNYMSPEQATGQPVDPKTDIFSFGIVFYEMLARRLPFKGETTSHTVIAILEKEPPRFAELGLDYPPELETIIEKCLAKSVEHRYPNAGELLKDLRILQKRRELQFEFSGSSEPRREPAQTEAFSDGINSKTSPRLQPTVSSLPTAPNNLTDNPEPLIGREQEIAEITNLLRQSGGCRILTLTGVGGAGKTRLAKAIARALLPDFPDGVFFIELAAVAAAEHVASAITQPLGVKETGGKPILEVLLNFLGDKKILLVIDNFEQVSAAAQQINELLAASRIKILITSRILLHLSAEREYVVPPLGVPSVIDEISPAALAAFDAVKLYIQRAQRVNPRFVLTEENASSVAEICARLDGLPLAIELAAARAKILSPAAILVKLENRLRLLTGGARDLPTRQQTMRGAIAWSYELLGEDEKKLFQRLSVFAGGFTFEAAESVCAGSETQNGEIDFLDLLTSLVDKSLLVRKESSATGETRFRMLEVVREYALELLEASAEAETRRRRHTEYFLRLSEQAEPFLKEERGIKWLNRLEEDHENLRAALNWALENAPETAARLAGALRIFWNYHGHFTEGRQWFEKILEQDCEMSPGTRWKILFGIGLIWILQGEYESARKFLEQSRETAVLAADRSKLGLSIYTLAVALGELGDLTAAKSLTEESLAIGKETGDKNLIGISVGYLGELMRHEGDYPAARIFFEESLEIFKKGEMPHGMMSIYQNLGDLCCLEGELEMSRFYYKKALEISRKLGGNGQIAFCLDGFAALAVKHCEFECATQLAGAAESLRESIGFVTEAGDRRFRDAYLCELKNQMDENAFAELYAEGRRLKLEEALALADSLNNDRQTGTFTPTEPAANPRAVE